ncbi:hypothetical protein EEB12_21700 [Rhodococcus sp. WS1]|nr:hypothetical protein EEB12_21700 [Rhodococcus sp. WS1]
MFTKLRISRAYSAAHPGQGHAGQRCAGWECTSHSTRTQPLRAGAADLAPRSVRRSGQTRPRGGDPLPYRVGQLRGTRLSPHVEYAELLLHLPHDEVRIDSLQVGAEFGENVRPPIAGIDRRPAVAVVVLRHGRQCGRLR